MAFGSNDFPLGPNGQFPAQRINSSNSQIAPPSMVEAVYAGRSDVKLPVTEKDFHSSVARPKAGMKSGKPHTNGIVKIAAIDRFRPRYAPPTGLRAFFGTVFSMPAANNSWLKRSNQRFPELQSRGSRQNIDPRAIRAATGMSGVGFFAKGGELGDPEQKYMEDEEQGRMNGVNYFRRPYR